MPSIYILNKQNYGLLFWGLGAVINIIGNYFLIQYFGYIGAAYSTALSYFIMMACLYVCNFSWMPIKYRWFYILINIFAGGCLLLLRYQFSFSFPFLAAFIYLIIPIYSIYKLFNFSYNE